MFVVQCCHGIPQCGCEEFSFDGYYEAEDKAEEVIEDDAQALLETDSDMTPDEAFELASTYTGIFER